MKMWCDSCGQAAEGITVHIQDELGYMYEILECPICGKEVYKYAGECVMCGEEIGPEHDLCELCKEAIEASILMMAEYRNVSDDNVKDGLSEYLNMEG